MVSKLYVSISRSEAENTRRWIEEKMKLLQLVPGNNYKIAACK
jgi:hypothetical protein